MAAQIRKPKFKVGQIVKDVSDGNFHPRRICEIRLGQYYCVPPGKNGHWFKQRDLRRLNKKERGA